jgi:hypothetical protein
MDDVDDNQGTERPTLVTLVRGAYHGNDVELVGYARLDDDGQLKAFGASANVGWDIPTLWGVDLEGRCFANDAHGGRLHRVTTQALMDELVDDEPSRSRARVALGLRPLAPSWVRVALAEGWAPPDSFRRGDYEW